VVRDGCESLIVVPAAAAAVVLYNTSHKIG
jgi:hypothetical protein